MNRLYIVGIFALIALALNFSSLTFAQQQQQPSANQQCSSQFEATIGPTCFDANGVNFSGIIFIISQNRTGAIPSGHTLETFLKLICGPSTQDKVVPCIQQQMQKYNSTPQCTAEDKNGVMGRAGQLLALMEGACGSPCEAAATQSLVQCYAAINVNPEPILSPNASIVEDKFSVIGGNESEYSNFCKNRQKLFSCLSPITATCPALLERLYAIGIDLNAMEGASAVLCQDKDKYLKGLACFATPSNAITQCNQQTMTNMRQVLIGRYQTGAVPPSKYQNSLCEVKVTQIDCELTAYQKSCDASLTELRTVAECSMLPKPCRENAPASTRYNGICQKVSTPAPIQTVRPTVPSGGPGMVGSRTSSPISGGSGNGAAELGASLLLLALTAGVGSLMF